MLKKKETIFSGILILAVVFLSFHGTAGFATNYPYDGEVYRDVKRDRIIAISEDYATLYYYMNEQNIDYSSYWGAICPNPTTGWKTGMKYCWGGEDSTKEFLLRMQEGDGAGNMDTCGGSSYDTF